MHTEPGIDGEIGLNQGPDATVHVLVLEFWKGGISKTLGIANSK